MSDTKNRNRQPEGVPVGGQYAPEAGASTGLALNVPPPVTLAQALAEAKEEGSEVVFLGEMDLVGSSYTHARMNPWLDGGVKITATRELEWGVMGRHELADGTSIVENDECENWGDFNAAAMDVTGSSLGYDIHNGDVDWVLQQQTVLPAETGSDELISDLENAAGDLSRASDDEVVAAIVARVNELRAQPSDPVTPDLPGGFTVTAKVATGIEELAGPDEPAYRLSATRNAAIPEHVRREDGFYAELGERGAVQLAFPNETAHTSAYRYNGGLLGRLMAHGAQDRATQ